MVINFFKPALIVIACLRASFCFSQAESPRPKYAALLIAVETYDSPGVPALTYPIKDAIDLRSVLLQYNFAPENITLLKNATYDEIQASLETLITNVTPNDYLLIFFSGQSAYLEEREAGYWWPRDANKDNTLRWFRNATLTDYVGAIPAKHTLLISDGCFSALFRSRSFNPPTNDKSREVIVSGLHSVPAFNKQLIKVLTQNQVAYLSSNSLLDQLATAMRTVSSEIPRLGRIQNVGDEGGQFFFWKNN